MKEIIKNGATTIFVSHSLDQMKRMCNKILWLDKGKQMAFDETVKVLSLYTEFLNKK